MGNEEPEGLRFFKMLITGFSSKLMLPSDFVDHNLKGERRECATLLSPDGKTWNVDCFKGPNEVYFGGDSWRDFMVANKLDVGCLILFHYKGNNVFTYRAFDASTREVSYSPSTDQIGQEVKEETISDDVYCEDYSISSSSSNAERGLNIKEETISDNDVDQKNGITGDPPKARSMKRKRYRHQIESKMTQSGTRFEATIKPYNLKRDFMYVPAFVAKSSWLIDCDKLILRDEKGRPWPVSITRRPMPKWGTELSTGWRKFAQGNQLEEGDKCIFDLVSVGKENHIQVQIIKGYGLDG